MKRLVLILLLLLPVRAKANVPVIDVSNLHQSILTAIRAMQSNINEAKMIAHQIKSLEHEIRNLTKLDYSVREAYERRFSALFSRVEEIGGLMQEFSSLERTFNSLYPEFRGEGVTGAEILEATDRWVVETRKMMLGASKVGATVLEAMPEEQAEMNRLLADSESSVGILQAAQSGNQIAAKISEQLVALNTQLSSYSQAHISYLQAINSKESASKARLRRVLKGLKDSAPPRKRVPLMPY